MTFDHVFKGYNPQEVDKYIADINKKHDELCAAQKQRIDELSDENAELRNLVERYKQNENAISQSLIESQKLAEQTKNNAEKFSQLTLLRAKIFYASWVTYSKTLVASLSDEEVKQFNLLKQKIEKLINAYEGGDVAKEVAAVTAQCDTTTPKTKANPIGKVENAQQIDLQELLHPTQDLGDICRDLGLKK